jgi:AAA domain
MSAYPEGFHAWPPEEKNTFFADAARAYDQERGESGEVEPAHAPKSEPYSDRNPRPSDYEPDGPPFDRDYQPPVDLPSEGPSKKFKIEHWSEIGFDLNTEWLFKGVLPKQGVGLIYGKSQSFKSFVAMHMALCVTLGRLWAGKRVEKTPVAYVAAEGAHGLRKRKAGDIKSWRDLPAEVDFHLVPAAPNLGIEKGDLEALVASIEGAGINPGLIVIDTVAKAIGAGDENGQGMATLLANAEALAQRFGCLVLCVHHVGHGQDAQDRPRGWSGLVAALDVMILAERADGAMSVTLTTQKLKDDASNVALTAHLSRVILGTDRDGDEVSTLVIDEVGKAEVVAKSVTKEPVATQRRLLMDVVRAAVDEAGEEFRPYANGPLVRAVKDEHIRTRLYAAIAEKAGPDEDPEKLEERQRKAFNRALASALNAKSLVAKDRKGKRFVWLP